MLWTGVEEFATDLGTDVSGSLAGNGLNLSQSPQASLLFVAVVHAFVSVGMSCFVCVLAATM